MPEASCRYQRRRGLSHAFSNRASWPPGRFSCWDERTKGQAVATKQFNDWFVLLPPSPLVLCGYAAQLEHLPMPSISEYMLAGLAGHICQCQATCSPGTWRWIGHTLYSGHASLSPIARAGRPYLGGQEANKWEKWLSFLPLPIPQTSRWGAFPRDN